ncbi:c-type cytochrome [Sabulicella rubraurantiaca]|uniref:c-type cytochrome n=1 Tax=Sabulicella rubraurantiaca TaxID=2811429 RepID=UPI001A97755C|nr:c-type cytochrome [Sabulicella rubraurantiaca]
MRALLLTVALLAPLPAFAQDASRGREIAENGAGDIAPCASCHGMDGRGVGAAQFPRLDGQHPSYLLKQLNDYAGEARRNEIMTPIAQALSEADRQAVAAWYGAQRFGEATTDPRPSELGERLVMQGDQSRGLQACVNCHGPEAAGLPPLFPRISGQHAEYAQAQFQAWREGARRNDVAGVMREISGRLSEAESAEISAYLEGLRSR